MGNCERSSRSKSDKSICAGSYKLSKCRHRFLGIKAVVSLNTEKLDPGNIRKSATPLRLWIGLNPGIKLRGVFVDVPQRFKTSPLNLIFKDLTGKLPLFDKSEIFFELLDFDVY